MKLSGTVYRISVWLCAALAAASFFSTIQASTSQQSSWTLDNVLKQLDTQAAGFQSLTADLERTKVTVVVNDKSTESGQISVRRDDKMRIEVTPRFTASRNTIWVTKNPSSINFCCSASGLPEVP
jgi:outer membrane lipoprotein-sorting protein